MKFKSIFYLLLLSGIVAGCSKDFLQKNDPNNIPEDLFYQNEQEATFGLYGIYDALQSNQIYGRFFNYMDEITDNGTNGTSTNGFREFEESAQSPLSARVEGFYTGFYDVVTQANYVIQKTSEMDADKIEDSSRKRIIAEASFLRNYAYFELTNLYRDVPFYIEPITAFSQGKAATPKIEILAFLKQDLIKTIPDLPVSLSDKESGRIGRAAAIALLGKIYLYEQDFGNAATTLGQLLKAPYNFELYPDYAELFTPLPAAEFASENIFQIVFSADGPDNGENFSETININLQPAKPRNYFTPSANLVDSYLCTDGKPIADSDLYGQKSPLYNANGANRFANRDPRLRASVLTSADVLPGGKKLWSFKTNNDFAIKKYIEVTTTQYSKGPQNVYLIRYADVLLMYAEAKNEVEGPVDSVYLAVNQVRKRVNMPDYPDGLLKEEMRQRIRDERRWEFAFEYQRYFDLRRWGIIKETLLNSGIAKKKFTEPRDYVWPLPQREIDNNPNIRQTAEWR